MAIPKNKVRVNPDGSLPANYRLGEYRIKSVLGIGGFGITYLARDTKLGALVAVKEYFPQSMSFRNDKFTIIPRGRGNATVAQNYKWGLKEFLKEARVLAKFKHNNIVRVLRFLEGNGSAYMVMEYEKGQSLAEFLKKRGGFLNEKDLLNVFLPILSGLQAVHKAGILHLDIKPDNIYLRSDGQPMLIDFGSAGQAVTKGDDKKAIALTPAYSAVENYPDMGKQGPSSDIYSIGATLYRCITGKHPVNAIDRHQALKSEQEDPLVAASTIERPRYSDYIRDSIDWALEVDQENRPQSALTLQQGIMGRGRFEETGEENNFNKFKSGYLGVVNVREKENKTSRSFLEVALILVLITLISVFSLIYIDVIDKDRAMASVSDVGKYFTAQDEDKGINILKNKALHAVELAKHKIHGTTPEVILKPEDIARLEKERKERLARKPVPVFDPNLKLLRKIKNRHGNIRHIRFARNNKVIITSSDRGRVNILDLESGKILKKYIFSLQWAPEIAVNSDGSLLAIADKATTLIIDSSNFQTIAMLAGHKDIVSNISFSPNNNIIATTGNDKNIILWNLYKQKIIKIIGHSNSNVNDLDFSPGGKRLASADENGGIKYWEASTGKVLASFSAQNGKINSIAYSNNGKWLAAAGEKKFLKLLSIGLTVKDQVPASVPSDISNITFTPDSKWLLALANSDNIYMWDLENNSRSPDLTGHKGNIYTVALSPDSKIIAAGGVSSQISIWKPEEELKSKTINTVPSNIIKSKVQK